MNLKRSGLTQSKYRENAALLASPISFIPEFKREPRQTESANSVQQAVDDGWIVGQEAYEMEHQRNDTGVISLQEIPTH
ncbi:MAG TPA: hypothetical protein V6D29_19295 [Leptolyngbyaceae cyanobacterium]